MARQIKVRFETRGREMKKKLHVVIVVHLSWGRPVQQIDQIARDDDDEKRN